MHVREGGWSKMGFYGGRELRNGRRRRGRGRPAVNQFAASEDGITQNSEKIIMVIIPELLHTENVFRL